MFRPTRSPAVLPVKELAAETNPDSPVVPLNQVTAPTSVSAPLSQSGLATATLLPASAATPPEPMLSPAVLP